jgi:hypothetical protein
MPFGLGLSPGVPTLERPFSSAFFFFVAFFGGVAFVVVAFVVVAFVVVAFVVVAFVVGAFVVGAFVVGALVVFLSLLASPLIRLRPAADVFAWSVDELPACPRGCLSPSAGPGESLARLPRTPRAFLGRWHRQSDPGAAAA